ncbi:CYFA0S36e00518g1_1 [Cyberlindnera fabianii]|uniref:DNA damage-inducible protein 1 n=1 Tax=Cyberlindnera fabianii TaxID=36022 RepID=A0A061BEA7_CYBFA|nr:CYFA0S36e00518g1_1 [Cyberlindnera fabianii]
MPQITASFEHNEQLIPLDVSLELTLNDLRAYVGAECGEEPDTLIITHNGQTLSADKGTSTLQELDFHDNDMISVMPTRLLKDQNSGAQQQQQQQGSQGAEAQIEAMRQHLLSNPQMLNQMGMGGNPMVENALRDPNAFAQMMRPLIDAGLLGGIGGGSGFGGGAQRAQLPGGVSPQEWERLQRTKDDPASQRRIQELEDLEEIQQSLELAMENTPEMFGQVSMLYVKVEVNGHEVKAFVDSGAQSTIISPSLAAKCGLTRLIDKRFKGVAMGVGRSEIIGRIHSAQLKVSSSYLPVSFTVVDAGVDMLLGLDMLRRHQASIDLKRDVLKIADVETPFLGEAEIPDSMFKQAQKGQALGGAGTGAGPYSTGQSASSAAAAAAASRLSQSSSQQSTSTASRPRAPIPSTNSSTFPESDISSLVGLGYSRQEAIRALEMAGGNVEVAASFLFQ